jgi:hypothetical protein
MAVDAEAPSGLKSTPVATTASHRYSDDFHSVSGEQGAGSSAYILWGRAPNRSNRVQNLREGKGVARWQPSHRIGIATKNSIGAFVAALAPRLRKRAAALWTDVDLQPVDLQPVTRRFGPISCLEHAPRRRSSACQRDTGEPFRSDRTPRLRPS